MIWRGWQGKVSFLPYEQVYGMYSMENNTWYSGYMQPVGTGKYGNKLKDPYIAGVDYKYVLK